MPHRILECVVGTDAPQLPESRSIVRVHTSSLLWNKEALLNKVIAQLPSRYQYVFGWMPMCFLPISAGSRRAYTRAWTATVIQPFSWCIHLERGETVPSFDIDVAKKEWVLAGKRHPRLWRSFAETYVCASTLASSTCYDQHGHVGFAWGAQRTVLGLPSPLYDEALMGGADHIIAHAAAGHDMHPVSRRRFQRNKIACGGGSATLPVVPKASSAMWKGISTTSGTGTLPRGSISNVSSVGIPTSDD